MHALRGQVELSRQVAQHRRHRLFAPLAREAPAAPRQLDEECLPPVYRVALQRLEEKRELALIVEQLPIEEAACLRVRASGKREAGLAAVRRIGALIDPLMRRRR